MTLEASLPATPMQANNGTLKGEVSLILHTRAACSLFNGSWQHHAMGLLQFAKVVNTLHHAAKQGCSSSILHLSLLQEKLHSAQQQFQETENYANEKLSLQRGFDITLFSNPNPARFPIAFSHILSYQAANILTRLDYITRIIYTLKKVGAPLPDINASKLVADVRAIFSFCRQYKVPTAQI